MLSKKSGLIRVCLVLAIALVVVISGTLIGMATGFSTTQLTNNSLNDLRPQVSGNNVVWEGFDGGDNEIFFYDGSTDTTTQLTDNSYYDNNPQVSGNNVVWRGFDGGDYEIFLYDGSSTTQLTNNSLNDLRPQVSGNNVVWQGVVGGDYEIFFYDGSTVTTVTNNSYNDEDPQVSGNNVVWQGVVGPGDTEIFFYDGSSTTQLTNNSLDNRFPQVSGNNVVWEGYHNLANDYNIFLYDGSSTTQLTDAFLTNRFPQVSGNNVVWEGYDALDPEIFLYDGSTVTQLTNNGYSDGGAQISGNNVVWQSYNTTTADPDLEIFFYDGSTVTQLTNNSYSDSRPQISGNNVVWQGNDGNDSEIFMGAAPDTQAPSTQLSTNPALPNGDNGWFKSNPDVTLVSNEPGTSYYRWNDEATYLAGTNFPTLEGDNMLYYFSADIAVNTETVNSQRFKVDTTDPTDPNVSSSSHAIGVPSGTTTVDIGISGATDTASGVDGFSVSWSKDATALPDATKTLEGTATVATSAPLSDGSWYFNLRTVDNAGNWTSTVHRGPFVIEASPPTTSLSTSPTSFDGEDGWFITMPQITLTPDESATTFYYWGSNSATQHVDPFLAAPKGENTLSYYSIDSANNTETTQSTIFKVDPDNPVDPDVSSSSHTTGTPSNDDTIDISIGAATDTISGVDGFSISWSPGASATPDNTKNLEETAVGTTGGPLADGSWWFNLKTKDNAGNWTSTTHLGPFVIDTTSPSTTLDATGTLGDNGWYKTNPTTITLSPDETATTYYSWDSTSSFTTDTVVTATREGAHTLYYFSVDSASNTETVKSSEIKIDSGLPSDPNVTGSTPAINTWTSGNTVEVNFSGATDTASNVDGFSVSWTKNAIGLPDTNKTLEETATVATSPSLSDGSWYFHLRTKDNAGNWTSTVHYGPFNIDKAKPTGIVSIKSGAAFTKSKSVTLNLSAVDTGGSGLWLMRARNKGGAWGSWGAYATTMPWTLSAGEGTKEVEVEFKDKAYNHSSIVSDTIRLDTIRPTVKVSAPRLSTDQTKNTKFRISWKGSDAAPASKIAHFDVQKRVNGGTWKTFISNTTKRAAYVSGKPGLNYEFRVRGEDRAGNVGKYSSVKKTIRPYDNGQLISGRSGFGFTRKSSKSNYYKNTIRYSKAPGDRITYKFTGNGVYLITTKAKSMSKIRVLINGKYIKTVNAYSAKKGYRRVVFKKFWSTKRTRKITLINVGNKALSHVDGLGVRK